MLASLRSRLRNDEDGFTLIELMVVVLIIAILIAIAIPTFLGVQDKAKDASVKSDLRNAVTNAKAIATDDGGLMTNVTDANLTAAEGSLDFDDDVANADADTIGIAHSTTAGESVLLIEKSKSDTWYGIVADKTGAVYSCSSDTAPSLTDCAVAANKNTDFKGI